MQNSNKKNPENNKDQKAPEKSGENKIAENPAPAGKSNRWLIATIFILLLIIVWGLMFYVFNLKGIFSEVSNFLGLRSGKYATQESAKESLNESRGGNAANQAANQGLASDVATNIPQGSNLDATTSGAKETGAGGIGNPTGSGQTGTGTDTTDEESAVDEEAAAEEEAPLDDYDFERAIDSIQSSFGSLNPTSVYDPAQLNNSELSLQ
ncbi:MAG: hypothetical protein NTZ97_00350 [Candidatus Moranbacteria bacterium]|nr:hypothetical protein [Candidatus Moranbacteria bacterium]